MYRLRLWLGGLRGDIEVVADLTLRQSICNGGAAETRGLKKTRFLGSQCNAEKITGQGSSAAPVFEGVGTSSEPNYHNHENRLQTSRKGHWNNMKINCIFV